MEDPAHPGNRKYRFRSTAEPWGARDLRARSGIQAPRDTWSANHRYGEVRDRVKGSVWQPRVHPFLQRPAEAYPSQHDQGHPRQFAYISEEHAELAKQPARHSSSLSRPSTVRG